MKTPEEIKKGMEVCATLDGDCESCPYDDRTILCSDRMRKDALAYNQQLESRLAQAEREMNAAVKDLSNTCLYFKHMSGSVDEPPCAECFHPKNNIVFAPITRTKFEWRGVCPENTKED